MTAQANAEANALVYDGAMIRDFTRMKPQQFYGSRVYEDPHKLIDQVYRIVRIIVFCKVEKVEFVASEFKGVAQVFV
ncbi:hypothetical protein MTR67_035009 [Solanum verrucosum]|uniref:Uncharacterized protein n=1 Tax=Solanum verrucosum TaxID=315347 RepID=A0AAF0U9M3_SOLVR|nr:hypothetical protein MTR67_035009 [Solanum verrucosum]